LKWENGTVDAKGIGILPLIEARRAEIAELCRRFCVQRLDVFGSAEYFG
jgi:hypothetical protein